MVHFSHLSKLVPSHGPNQSNCIHAHKGCTSFSYHTLLHGTVYLNQTTRADHVDLIYV